MAYIIDNIQRDLLAALQDVLESSTRADFCVGYFNLRGWKGIAHSFDSWDGTDANCCRLLIGMPMAAEDELRQALSMLRKDELVDNTTLIKMKTDLAQHFRDQLTYGAPIATDETGLRELAKQLRSTVLRVKLYLSHPLHAKLYLCHKPDDWTKTIGFIGSSNLTLAGLSKQGELNIDVLDHQQNEQFLQWFEDRWGDRCSIDISKELADIIEESWAGEEPKPPYWVYLKMAYHLSQEARAGLDSYAIPKQFQNILLPFQEQAVRMAAGRVKRHGGVLLADVVGLGKTLMATAIACVLQDDLFETLIICPKNLVPMWNSYRTDYGLNAEVLSLSRVLRELPTKKRFRLVVIDESHNLRSSDSESYKAVRNYIERNDSKCILLTATPYNKTFVDLGNQIGLFLGAEVKLPVRPEKLIRALGTAGFAQTYQCQPNTLQAFMKSEHADDWREIMGYYMVRRTRSFIKANYAKTDDVGRDYLPFPDGRRHYLPERIASTVPFPVDEEDPSDQYAKLYDDAVVDVINRLHLPRYGLGNYVADELKPTPSPIESEQLQNLAKAGKRLIGFCRTNLFKRLESCGDAFLQSVRSHILRNSVYLYAINNGLELPIGTLDATALSTLVNDEDTDTELTQLETIALDAAEEEADEAGTQPPVSLDRSLQLQGEECYRQMRAAKSKRYKWLRASLFSEDLHKHLEEDSAALLKLLELTGEWRPESDKKLKALADLVQYTYPNDKVLIFSQFADTVRYLGQHLSKRGVKHLASVIGSMAHPERYAHRFSPESNGKRRDVSSQDELRVLVTTDVLSEGQNLQDCHVVVNFDIPWAIISLIQRVGRTDRIGQKAEKIYCHTFMPAEGVERIIRLREKVRGRLRDNAEVVGTDEAYGFEEFKSSKLHEIYTEKNGVYDEDEDDDVDLASRAYQIYKNAIDADPKLAKIIPGLPNVIYSTKAYVPTDTKPEGALVYVRTGVGNDVLAWADRKGNIVTDSPTEILRAAECKPDTPALPRFDDHHELVSASARQLVEQSQTVGGQLGRPHGARFKSYQKLEEYMRAPQDSLFAEQERRDVERAMQEIYLYPLTAEATDKLNRQLKLKATTPDIIRLVLFLREEGRLCQLPAESQDLEPRIICSLGLRSQDMGHAQ